MTIYEYTALKNRWGASNVVRGYNLQPANDPKGLALQLAHCVKMDGQRALSKVADVHPDLKLFQSKIDDFKAKIKAENSEKKCSCQSNFSNVSGQGLKSEVESIKDDKSHSSKDLMIIGGVIVIALALIKK